MSDGSKTLEEVQTSVGTWDDLDSQQIAKFYDKWAETYDQDLAVVNYKLPDITVEFLNANFSGNPEEVQILDVACGSGLVAKEMVKLGFKHFVGVDASKKMLELAAKTGFYQDLKLAILGIEPLPAQNGEFDLVMMVGGTLEGHVHFSIVRELCQATKPGGYICISNAENPSEAGRKYKMGFEKELQLMEAEGLWTHVDTKDMHRVRMDFKSNQFVNGTMRLYRRSLQ